MAVTNRKGRLRASALTNGGGKDEGGGKAKLSFIMVGGNIQTIAFVGLFVALLLMWAVNTGIDSTKKMPQRQAGLTKTGSSTGRTRSNTLERKSSSDVPQISQSGRHKKVVTAYLDPPITSMATQQSASSSRLLKQEFPSVQSCSRLTLDFGKAAVNSYGTNDSTTILMDPWLPWLHDFFLSSDGKHVVFIGQNRRNCNTGKNRQEVMQFWEPQIALFQPLPVVRTNHRNGTSSFRLFYEDHDPHEFAAKTTILHNRDNNIDIESQEVLPETRFLCRFHWQDEQEESMEESSSLSLSKYPFNYEYVTFRKKKRMFSETDRSEFWISQLLFYCLIPARYQASTTNRQLLVDVIPIRTPPRSQFWLTPTMIGKEAFEQVRGSASSRTFFDITTNFENDPNLPAIAGSGRWANLPVCPLTTVTTKATEPPSLLASLRSPLETKPYRLVLCTWTSASYHRRGEDEEPPLEDNAARLREWLIFHRLVGFDHVVIYDNTPEINAPQDSPLYSVIHEFEPSYVTHQPWPAVICNNHRPGHKNPGDRSSQYAAEASCRERYGPLTDWMAFIDTDEYLTPMKTTKKESTDDPITWKPILDDMERREVAILKFKSGRGLPRVHLMDPLENQRACGNPVTERFLKGLTPEPCLIPRRSETFLKVHNCDSVKLPRPERFQRAMKQLYRPDYVLSHFVHYSTVTEFTAAYYDPINNPLSYFGMKSPRFDPAKEVFVNELKEGVLIHARSVQPKETMFRNEICRLNYRKMNCLLGYECPDSVEWIDDLGRQRGAKTKKFMNMHHDEQGNFCSCWVNHHVEQVWVPLLERALSQHLAALK